MSKPELIRKLKLKNSKLNTHQLDKFIDYFFESIIKSLKKKKSVELRGFGTFVVKEMKEKFSARNPKTGKLIYVPKKLRIRFKTSKKFKEFINQ